MVVERFGRFHRRCDAGFHFLVPFIDVSRRIVWRASDVFLVQSRYGGDPSQQVQVSAYFTDRIDLRETIMDFPNQAVITRDNVQIAVHPMLLVRLVDPVRVCYEVYDLPHAVEKLVQTTLRAIIGDMGLDDTLASREEIERALKSKVSRVCLDWGLEIKSAELLEISPTKTIQEAMHRQLAAERIRRAAIVSADGVRERLRLEAEGDCQSATALATGEAQATVIVAQAKADARRLVAKAEADAVRTVAAALPGVPDPTQYLVGLRYIAALQRVACAAAKREVFLPLETDVAGGLGGIGLPRLRR